MERTITQLVILAVVYALQQLLTGKFKKKTPYRYPDEDLEDDLVLDETDNNLSYEELHYEGKYRMGTLTANQQRASNESKNKIATVEKVPNAWNGKLSNKHMIHGFVMAELFAPPRSLNPYKIKKY